MGSKRQAATSRVTVVIPTFNRARYLEAALESVLAQAGDDFVVLVCDNSSDDDTPEVVARHLGPRVGYVRRSSNVGWLANFNLGVADVETEFVTILGDDDIMLDGALARAVDGLDSHPTAGFVHTAFEEIDAQGRLLDRPDNWTRGLVADTTEPGRVFIRRSMRSMVRVGAPSAVMRMDALPSPPFDPADGQAADLGLWLRIALDHDVLFLATPGVAIRRHEQRDSERNKVVSVDGVSAHLPSRIIEVRDVKRRFIERNRGSLDDVAFLERDVARFVADELTREIRARSADGRTAMLGSWWNAVRTEPRIVGRPRTWVLLARAVLGHEWSARLRRRTPEGPR